MTFADPLYLLLLLLVLLYVVWYWLMYRKSQASLQISSTKPFVGMRKTLRNRLIHLPFLLTTLALISMIIALARPQSYNSWQKKSTEGVEIMMVLDLSSSMLAEDLKPNRLEAAKNVGIQFISGRPNDELGLVVFSSESFTQCPLTLDHGALINLTKEVRSGMIQDGTAIGMGLTNAVARLKDGKAKSKTVILLTDGSNNAGEVSPLTAADFAAREGIRVYTIGVGTRGFAPYPIQTPFGIQYQDVEVDIDENVLMSISEKTNGKYFRATDNKSLKAIYEEIDMLEKSILEEKNFTKKTEEFMPFVVASFVFLLLEFLLKRTVLRTIP